MKMIRIWKCLRAANWKVNLLRRPGVETVDGFSLSSRGGAVSSGHVCGSVGRLFSTSRTDLLKPRPARSSKHQRRVRRRPRHAVILFTMRRGGTASRQCLRAVGGKAAASPLTLPPSPTVSSSLLWFQFSRP